MTEDYSDKLPTIRSRRCYHKKTKAEKRKIFKRQNKLKKAKVKKGFCYKCAKKRERPEITLCNSCLDKQASRIKEYRINNALEGKCCKCSNKADGDSSHCKECKEKARLANRVRRAALNATANRRTRTRTIS